MFKSFILDIIIQSGEFVNQNDSSFWSDLFNTAIGSAIGSAATIGAVYLTFRKDRKKESDKKVQFEVEKIKYFQALVKNTITKLSPQISAIEKLHLAIDANPLYIPIMETQTLYELDRLVHKINQEEYYHSYLSLFGNTNEAIEEFRKIYIALDYFEANLRLIKQSIEKSIDFDYTRKKSLVGIGNKAMDMAAQMLVNKDIAHEKKLLEFINHVIIQYYKDQTEGTDLKYLQDKFVDTIKPELIKSGRHIAEVNNLVIELKSCTHLYNEIQMQNKELANDCKDWQQSLTLALKEFETASTRLINYQS